MFEAHSEEIDRLAAASALQTCWAQWVALGSPAAPATRLRATSIVDPEALVILSLCLLDRERRLLDLVSWWARVGSRFLSVQRFRSVARRIEGGATSHALAVFATHAQAHGDRRWSRHVVDGVAPAAVRDKGPDEPSLARSCTLWLRLRAGFGVGAKADTLAHLLGIAEARASVKAIALATGYSSVAARTAASEMAAARFIRETSDRPAGYRAPRDAWARVLDMSGGGDMPGWRFWSEHFAFLVAAMRWAEDAGSPDGPGPHVVASRARDLMERHERAFELDRIPVPRPGGYRGLQAAGGLLETTRVVAEWVEEHV